MVYSRKPGAHRNKEVMNLDLESFILKVDLLMEATLWMPMTSVRM